MSIENRPNLHAVGFLTDIVESLEKRIRGHAGEAGIKEVFPLLRDDITEFVEKVDAKLDERFKDFGVGVK